MFAPAIALVDLETTGATATGDRITEIGIIRVAEGEFTGGNLFYIRRELWPAVERVLTRVYEARKKPWLLANLLGPRILWRYFRRGGGLMRFLSHDVA